MYIYGLFESNTQEEVGWAGLVEHEEYMETFNYFILKDVLLAGAKG